jgi:hypothetical protein
MAPFQGAVLDDAANQGFALASLAYPWLLSCHASGVSKCSLVMPEA